MIARLDPRVTVTKISPNQSQRTAKIKLIVVHVTEARRLPVNDTDLHNLADWFSQESAQVSSNVATNSAGHSARFVSDNRKAWAQAAYNSVALSIEQVGESTDSAAVWRQNHSAQLHETARWIARWSKAYGVPIRHGKVWRGHVIRKGVVRHSDLGDLGGGHLDCPGAHYPLALVLSLAREYRKHV